jgi:hypothetical protein
MSKMMKSLAALCLFSVAGAAAQAQFYKIHNADIAGSGIGQFTTVLTSNTPIQARTTDSFGGLFSIREHPVSWAGIEVNYSYNRYTQDFTSPANAASPVPYDARVKTNVHEATAAYMFHPHFRNLQPFINIGGGALDFAPTTVTSVATGSNQWRGAGLLEVGFDVPTSNPHFGFRVQGRTLVYRAPNYNNALLSSKSWVSTEEPTFGAYYRF